MHSVIVTPRLFGPSHDDEMGQLVFYLARLLRDNGQRVSIILTGSVEVPKERWEHLYQANQISVEYVQVTPPGDFAPTYYDFIRCSEAVTAKIPADTDIVYFQDWQANGFHFVRSRRFGGDVKPVCITILHGGTDWLTDATQQFPIDVYEGTALSFAERYVVRYSDFVVSFSQYMIDWVSDQGWHLPPTDRIRVLGRPLLREVNDSKHTGSLRKQANHFKRLVFWGRLETRKGFDLLIDALLYLGKNNHRPYPGQLDEIVFIGREGKHKYDRVAVAAQMLKATGLKVNWLDLDLESARQYLTDNVVDSLVVLPSLSDNVPYTALEVSLISGLNFICSKVDGITGMFGSRDSDQFFDAYVRPLAAKIESWLLRGPKMAGDLAEYDWESANRHWLAFLVDVGSYAKRRQATPVTSSAAATPDSAVDVCVAYFNHGTYLPQLLASLEQQTVQDFNVFVVNDGSTEQQSIEIFSEMEIRYQSRGWRFITKENSGPSSTRNFAASQGQAEYICFVDADNVAAPKMIERLRSSIRYSGDDCLTCYLYAFEGDAFPYRASGEIVRAHHLYTPLGNAPEAGIFSNVLGDANLIVRRAVFQKLGGFSAHRLDRYLDREDYEFLARLSLQGYQLDVVPEFLCFYRYRSDSLLHTTNYYQGEMRVLRVFKQHLQQVGLGFLVPLIRGLSLETGQQPAIIEALNDSQWIARHVTWRTLGSALIQKGLERLKRK